MYGRERENNREGGRHQAKQGERVYRRVECSEDITAAVDDMGTMWTWGFGGPLGYHGCINPLNPQVHTLTHSHTQRETERERERERSRETETETERDRDRDRQRQTERKGINRKGNRHVH